MEPRWAGTVSKTLWRMSWASASSPAPELMPLQTVARHPGIGLSRRRFVGPQVEGFLPADFSGGGGGEVGVAELNRTRGLSLVKQENELRAGDGNAVRVMEDSLRDRHAVDESAVDALQIPDVVLRVLLDQDAVPPRYPGVADANRIGGVAAEPGLVFLERKHRAEKRPAQGHELWTQVSDLSPRADMLRCGPGACPWFLGPARPELQPSADDAQGQGIPSGEVKSRDRNQLELHLPAEQRKEVKVFNETQACARPAPLSTLSS
jgi:hypothetical protein